MSIRIALNGTIQERRVILGRVGLEGTSRVPLVYTLCAKARLRIPRPSLRHVHLICSSKPPCMFTGLATKGVTIIFLNTVFSFLFF